MIFVSEMKDAGEKIGAINNINYYIEFVHKESQM